MSVALSVRDLRVRYPLDRGLSSVVRGGHAFVDVVHGVSLDVNRGETLAVVGESGSGKTTLAMALSGLVPIHRGEVRLDGRVVGQDRNRRLCPDRRRVALLFQDAVGSLSPRMTIGRLLAEPFRIHRVDAGDPATTVQRLLSQVGLSADFAGRYPHQLSGGQARRVGVARALALRPDVLIADEPTAGLDVSIQGGILNLLSRLQREMGLAIVIITHNLHVVRHVADRTAVMYLGRFVEQGDSAAIFSRPRHPYTAALLAANPSPDPEAQLARVELRGEVASLLHRPSGCEFHTRCPRVQRRCRSEFPESLAGAGESTCNCFFPMN